MRPTVLILGAGSDIGQACAYRFAEQAYDLQLTSRGPSAELDSLQSDLRIRYECTVTIFYFTAGVTSAEDFITRLPKLPEVVVCCIGLLAIGDQLKLSEAELQQVFTSNFTGLTPLLNVLASQMVMRSSGTLIGISSVAGERGRASNYAYGAAKAAFTAFLSGLRQRCTGTGVKVVTIKPGFVRTRMLGTLSTPALLTAEPEIVARHIYRALKHGRSEVYIYPVWRYLMWIIRHIPESIFQRLPL